MADPKKPDVAAFVPRTKEEIAQALKERRELSSMLTPPAEPRGQASAGAPPVTYVEPVLPPSPPAPVVDTTSIRTVQQSKLAEIKAKVERRRVVQAELAECQKNSAALITQMKLDETKLAWESEALEREVGDLQREIAAAEAQQLAAQALRDQATRGETERLPLKAWQAKWREAILPLRQRIVGGLGKLQAILRDRGATLEQVSALRSPPGLDDSTRSEFIAVSTSAGKLIADLHEAIRQHERALGRSEDFQPDPSSSDGVTACNEIRYELEQASGVTTGKLVDLVNPRVIIPAGVGIEGSTPAAAELEHRTAELLGQYAAVQKKANKASRPMPTITIEILPKGERPRHEVLAELRGPKPEQTRAAGVPKED